MNGVISPGPGEDGKIFFRDVSHHITWQMENLLIQLTLTVLLKSSSPPEAEAEAELEPRLELGSSRSS